MFECVTIGDECTGGNGLIEWVDVCNIYLPDSWIESSVNCMLS